MLGLLGAGGPVERSYTVITIAARGRAEARAEWAAKGYDPAKNYMPRTGKKSPLDGLMFPPPEPLPPGAYDVTIAIPMVRYGVGLWKVPTQIVRVNVTR